MEKKHAKRFYKQVSYVPKEGGFEVMLDERSLKTPAKEPLILPNEALAGAIRDEFDAQTEAIVPESMPIFSLAATAIDRVMTQRQTLDEELVRYGHNDLISYRCSAEEDAVLAAREAEKWGAIQAWMAETYQVRLLAFDSIMPQSQPAEIKPHLEAAVTGIDQWAYVALYRATTLTGSLSLGLGFVTGHLNVDQLMALAFLDDLYQEEKWGTDEWAVERRDHIQQEIQDAFSYLALLS